MTVMVVTSPSRSWRTVFDPHAHNAHRGTDMVGWHRIKHDLTWYRETADAPWQSLVQFDLIRRLRRRPVVKVVVRYARLLSWALELPIRLAVDLDTKRTYAHGLRYGDLGPDHAGVLLDVTVPDSVDGMQAVLDDDEHRGYFKDLRRQALEARLLILKNSVEAFSRRKAKGPDVATLAFVGRNRREGKCSG